MEFTKNIFKRYDRGASVVVMSALYFYLISVVTFVFTPEFSRDHSLVTTAVVYVITIFLGLTSYTFFLKTALTDPGMVKPEFIHAMPAPNFSRRNAEDSLVEDSNISENDAPLTQEDIFHQILQNYDDYANMKESRDQVDQTNVTDCENPAGFVVQSNRKTLNFILNTFCYRHCFKCGVDQPPRSEHCDM